MDFQDQMIQNNYLNLAETDYIKFVIDNSWKLARAVLIKQHLQNEGCKALFAFSPVGANPELAGEMAQWLIEFKIDDVLLNIQIHKIINVK